MNNYCLKIEVTDIACTQVTNTEHNLYISYFIFQRCEISV